MSFSKGGSKVRFTSLGVTVETAKRLRDLSMEVYQKTKKDNGPESVPLRAPTMEQVIVYLLDLQSKASKAKEKGKKKCPETTKP